MAPSCRVTKAEVGSTTGGPQPNYEPARHTHGRHHDAHCIYRPYAVRKSEKTRDQHRARRRKCELTWGAGKKMGMIDCCKFDYSGHPIITSATCVTHCVTDPDDVHAPHCST